MQYFPRYNPPSAANLAFVASKVSLPNESTKRVLFIIPGFSKENYVNRSASIGLSIFFKTELAGGIVESSIISFLF